MTSELHTPLTLADLIDKELMGVEPDSQCIILDDADWKMITAALRRYTIEFTRCVSCDGYNCDDGCAYPDTRAVPDVPELVRYRAGIHSRGYEDENGEYVRYDQAVAVIAAKDAELERLKSHLEMSSECFDCGSALVTSCQYCEKVKHAQIEKQGEVGYAVNDKTGFRNFHTTKPNIPPEDLIEYEITITPLYTAPVASDADLRAVIIEQCRKAVRNAILRMPPEHRADGDICDDVIAHALAALNPSEPQA